MARNEDGEFELILGNKQLLSVFFLMVLLLGLCFVGGYVLGRSAAPVLTASSQPAPEPSKPAAVEPPKSSAPPPAVTPPPAQPQPEPVKATPPPPPTKTAPQVTESAPIRTMPQTTTQVAKAEPSKAKAEPPPAPKQTAAAKPAPSGSQPVPGRVYLQLSATDKDKADVMVDLLRRKSFPGMAAAVAERPGLYRVLVGPIAENGLNDMKARLKAGGFPSDEAIRRVF